MNTGLDINGNKIAPFKGGRARCGLCKDILIAHVGEIIIPHWQHDQERECDPWQEHETQWHRDWKNKFPLSIQEVVINRNGVLHRADVLLDEQLVIEFQHSHLSTVEIKKREAFYENMIWIVDAQIFASNFKMECKADRIFEKVNHWVRDERFVERITLKRQIDEIKEIQGPLPEQVIKLAALQAELDQITNNIEQEAKIMRLEAVEKYKNHYFIQWNYERKSWRAAEKQIYFDVGNNTLFQQIKPAYFIKLTYQDLLDRLYK